MSKWNPKCLLCGWKCTDCYQCYIERLEHFYRSHYPRRIEPDTRWGRRRLKRWLNRRSPQ